MAASLGRGLTPPPHPPPPPPPSRNFWRRKGDVFHLLLSLAIVLDDRVWPKEDERDVRMLVSLVYHVTGEA